MSTKPVLFVTGHLPPDRAGAFAALHARVPLELALFGGRVHHATAGAGGAPGAGGSATADAAPGAGGSPADAIPTRHVSQRQIARLAASGRYAAVVCGTAGRTALPAAYAGARASRTPFVLWTAMWTELRTPAHLAARPLLRRIHRDADAVVTYGPHVTAFARSLGARNVVEAPQAVDQGFWQSFPADRASTRQVPTFCFVGRSERAKGLGDLVEAWRASSLDPAPAALVLVGAQPEDLPAGAGGAVCPHPPRAPHAPVRAVGRQPPEAVRNFLNDAGVLVVPSIPTRHFLEPWGLVCNEAMHLGLPVIATDAVGAAAGGLVRHERNGLVVPAGDVPALTAAIRRLRDDAALRERLGAAARRDAAAFTHTAWAAGFAAALEPISHRKDC